MAGKLSGAARAAPVLGTPGTFPMTIRHWKSQGTSACHRSNQ